MSSQPKYVENEFESRIERFEATWQNGFVPDIGEFLLSEQFEPQVQRRLDLITELVMIDLEYRWRRVTNQSTSTTKPADRSDDPKYPFPQRPLVEDYIGPFPELRDGKLTKVIASEYHTRHRWGDRPGHDEYLRRFPEYDRTLSEALRRVDQRLPRSSKGDHLRIRCPDCHAPIDSTTLDLSEEIECTSCHCAFSLICDEPSSRRIAPGGKVGSFQLIEKLGSGSFGTVWRARDTQLDRNVAIKIPHREQFQPQQIEQFLREARTAAQLNHPHIVSVHEVGRDAKTVFIVSDLIDGPPLSDWLTDRRLSAREAAGLCQAIAHALDHAHQAGVIHRDLKPSNIIMDSDGQPHLTDFGLARRELEVTMTRDGQLLGTPAYMSPEQAKGEAHDADQRSDIYSTGVLLYELLTDEQPFRGSVRMLLRQIVDEDAVSPRKLNNSIPRDLETICLKCLEKDPANRVPTASELAEELQRFLEDRPIHARPISRVARAWRWCSRNPLTSALAAMLTMALACGFVVVTFLWISASNARDLERRRSVSLAFDRGLDLCQRGTVKEGMLWLARSLEFDQQSQELSRVIRTNMAVWGTHCFPLVTFLPDHGAVYSGAFSPDGKKLLTGTSDGVARVWDTQTGKLIGQPMIHGDWIESAVFSPDGTTVLTGSTDQTARQWDFRTGRQIGSPLVHNDRVRTVAYSPDGEKFVTGAGDGEVQLWDAKTNERIGRPFLHDSRVNSVDFSPNGELVLSGAEDSTARLWHIETGECLKVLTHRGKLHAVKFSPDGSRFATGGDTDFIIWDTATSSPLQHLRGHAGRVSSVAFGPDGRWILGGCGDAKALIWNVEQGILVQQISMLAGEVRATAFSRDGSRVFVGSTDHSGLVYDARHFPFTGTVLEHGEAVWGAEFTPDGKMLVTGSNDGLRLWDVASCQLIKRAAAHNGRGESAGIAFPRKGNVMVAAHHYDPAQLWTVPDLQPVGSPMEHQGWVGLVDFKPDGSHVLTVSFDQKARLWDVATGRLIRELPHEDRLTAVAFSPDGKRFLTGSADKLAQLWDADTFNRIGKPLQHRGLVLDAKFSPDGQLFATASSAGLVWLWDANTRRPVRGLHHNARVRSISFSPDCTFLAAGCEDGEVRFWDVRTGQPITLPRRHIKRVSDVPFSPDGGHVASASWDGTVRLWNTPPAPVEGDMPRIVLWIQVLTAQELDEAGSVRFLDRETWLERRAQLQALGGPPVR